MTTNKGGQSKIAIIGMGKIGQIIVTNLVTNQCSVIIASRDKEKSIRVAEHLGRLVTPMSIGDAIRNAGIVILAIWYNEIKEFIYRYDALLEGKILVDPSNPIALNDHGGFDKIIGENDSAGQINASVVPKGAKLVKALGTLSAVTLARSANQKPESVVLFYATDDIDTNNAIEQLILDMGFAPFRVGNLDQSIRIEVFGDLHEVGGLGKPVTKSELKLSV